MSYIKAELVLPKEVLELVQKYADGQILYIPRKKENYKSWGENTKYKQIIEKRNREIYYDYLNGSSTAELAKEYCLSIKSIQRIILQFRRKEAV